MRYYRYMSYAEFEKILKGEILSNQSQWRSVSGINLEDNSTGFCFLREQVASNKGYFANPLECYMSMSGIVCPEVLVCFEKLDEVKMKESYGRYASLDGGWGIEFLDEYSIPSYSKDTFVPVGFYVDIDEYGTLDTNFNPIKVNLSRDNADLKMLLIYEDLSLDFLEEHIFEFDEECFRLCAAYQKLDEEFIKKYQEKFNEDAWYELILKQDVPEEVIISNLDKFDDFSLLSALLGSKNLNEKIFDEINKEYSSYLLPNEDDIRCFINTDGFSSDFILNHLEGLSAIRYKPETNPNGQEFCIYLNKPLSESCKDIFMSGSESFIRNFWGKCDENEYSDNCFSFFSNFLDNPNCRKVFIEKFQEAIDLDCKFRAELIVKYYSLLTPE